MVATESDQVLPLRSPYTPAWGPTHYFCFKEWGLATVSLSLTWVSRTSPVVPASHLLLSTGWSLQESPSQHVLNHTCSCSISTLALHCLHKEASVERWVQVSAPTRRWRKHQGGRREHLGTLETENSVIGMDTPPHAHFIAPVKQGEWTVPPCECVNTHVNQPAFENYCLKPLVSDILCLIVLTIQIPGSRCRLECGGQ